MTRILFMGTPDFAVPSLRALIDGPGGLEVVAVVTRPDKPAGRGRRLMAPPVKQLAESRQIAVLQPKGLKKPEIQEQIRRLAPDLIVVAAYGRILPQAVLDIPSLACVNVHASLLPHHRGASPIAHAILAGDLQVGVSIMRMEAGLDTGPVYLCRQIPTPLDATTGSLSETLADLGAEALLHALPGIIDGSLAAEPQEDSAASLAPLLDKGDGKLDFNRPARELERRVRAFWPWPGAFFLRSNLRVGVECASLVEGESGEPGRVLAAGKLGLTVACGAEAIRLERVKPAGKKSMAASAWVAGRGAAVGDCFE